MSISLKLKKTYIIPYIYSNPCLKQKKYLYLQCHRSKNEGLGCPHYRKCGFFMPLFFPVYIFVLVIRLIIAINTKSCN